MKYIIIILNILLMLLAVLLIVENLEQLSENTLTLKADLLFWSYETPPMAYYLVFIIAFLAGIFVASYYSIVERFKLTKKIKILSKEHGEKDKEEIKPRNLTQNLKENAFSRMRNELNFFKNLQLKRRSAPKSLVLVALLIISLGLWLIPSTKTPVISKTDRQISQQEEAEHINNKLHKEDLCLKMADRINVELGAVENAYGKEQHWKAADHGRKVLSLLSIAEIKCSHNEEVMKHILTCKNLASYIVSMADLLALQKLMVEAVDARQYCRAVGIGKDALRIVSMCEEDYIYSESQLRSIKELKKPIQRLLYQSSKLCNSSLK